MTYGVFGDVTSSDGQGVVGDAIENGLIVPEGRPSGVIGATDRSGSDLNINYGHGVVGVTLARNSTSYGVAGESTTPDGAGIRGLDRDGNGLGVLSDGDSKTNGTHQVTGDIDVGGSRSVSKVNVTAELDTDQSIGGTFETVEFDIAEGDWGAFDTSTGEFTAPSDGTYRVTVHLTWDTLFSNGIHSEAEIRKGGFLEARNLGYVAGDGSNGRLDHSFSKTMSTGSGQVIEARLSQDSGSSALLRGKPAETYMCITKVG